MMHQSKLRKFVLGSSCNPDADIRSTRRECFDGKGGRGGVSL